MSAPRISVVLPAFNSRRTLGDALASALEQTFDELEIIVVDDGSTDRTADVAMANDNPRVRLVRHDRNLGTAAARNSGVAVARGRFVAFLDSDDCWFPEKLETQFALLEAAGGDAAVPGSVHSVLLRRPAGQISRHLLPVDLDLRRDLMWGCRLCPGSTLLVTRDCLDAVGPFDATLERLEDWDWLLRFSERYRLAVASAPLASVRHPSRATLEQVNAALRILRVKHVAASARLDWVERRKLESTLYIEGAGAAYRDGDVVRAVLATARALARYPFRNTSFYRRVARIAVECLAGPSRVDDAGARRESRRLRRPQTK